MTTLVYNGPCCGPLVPTEWLMTVQNHHRYNNQAVSHDGQSEGNLISKKTNAICHKPEHNLCPSKHYLAYTHW